MNEPMVRKYYPPLTNKNDLKSVITPYSCHECPLCVEVLKDEFKELFTQEIHVTINNPFYKEYVSDGKCDYRRSFHSISNPQYLHILDPKYYNIKKKRQEILNEYGEDYLYHLVCKKDGNEIKNETIHRKCTVESDGVFPMRRPKNMIHYANFTIPGFDVSVYIKKMEEIEKSHEHNIKIIQDETDLPLNICRRIYRLFECNKSEIDKFINKLIETKGLVDISEYELEI